MTINKIWVLILLVVSFVLPINIYASTVEPYDQSYFTKADGIVEDSTKEQNSVVEIAMKYIGTPYVFGGTSVNGFDCSGLVQYVFKEAGYDIPRTSKEQSIIGDSKTVTYRGNLKIGDILFFDFRETPDFKPVTSAQGALNYASNVANERIVNGISHVGVYIGNNKMVHAGSNGVAVANLNKEYYKSKFIYGKRIIQ